MFASVSRKETESGSSSEYEDHERLLVEEKSSFADTQRTRSATRGPSWWVTAVAIICTAILSTAFGAWIARHDRRDADDFCIRHTSQYCEFDNSKSFL